jgi:translation initiation factor 1
MDTKAIIDRLICLISFMASPNRKSLDSTKPQETRFVYREFGDDNPALARGVPDLPASEQNIRVQASRKGRKGKTVTVITGFQAKPETLNELVKKLKTQCGTGGTVKENEIEIQGEHTQKLLQILTQLGYKAKISGG